MLCNALYVTHLRGTVPLTSGWMGKFARETQIEISHLEN